MRTTVESFQGPAHDLYQQKYQLGSEGNEIAPRSSFEGFSLQMACATKVGGVGRGSTCDVRGGFCVRRMRRRWGRRGRAGRLGANRAGFFGGPDAQMGPARRSHVAFEAGRRVSRAAVDDAAPGSCRCVKKSVAGAVARRRRKHFRQCVSSGAALCGPAFSQDTTQIPLWR